LFIVIVQHTAEIAKITGRASVI